MGTITTSKRVSQGSEEASGLVAVLEAYWAELCEEHADIVPNPVFTFGSGLRGRGAVVWGHYGHLMWSLAGDEDGSETRPEVFISTEALGQGALRVITTLRHEATHSICATRGVRDVGAQGRHLVAFRDTAKELGLVVTDHPTLGWSPTEASEELEAASAAWVARISEELTAESATSKYWKALTGGDKGDEGGDEGGDAPARPSTPLGPRGGGSKPKSRNYRSMSCGCGNVARFRDDLIGKVVCTDCDEAFIPKEDRA